MKIKILVCISIVIMLMGCSKSVENNNKTEQISVADVEGEMKLSELCNWKNAKIKNTAFFPNFQDGLVVQSADYVFYIDDGNKLTRIDKVSKEEKTIVELKVVNGRQIGVHFCLTKSGLYLEYAGDIYSCDFDGNNMIKNISCNELKKSISVVMNEKSEDYGDISSIKFYKNNLYMFSGFNILKLDIKTKKIMLMAEDSTGACFYNNALYYVSYSFTVIYKLDLSTQKRKRVRGKETIISAENSGNIKYYDNVIEVDNQMYFVQMQNGKKPVLYKYCEEGEDEKIYEYDVEDWSLQAVINDSTKVACEYVCDNKNDRQKLTIYDIKEAVATEIEMPSDFETVAYIVGDMVFYIKNNSDDEYLSYFSYE